MLHLNSVLLSGRLVGPESPGTKGARRLRLTSIEKSSTPARYVVELPAAAGELYDIYGSLSVVYIAGSLHVDETGGVYVLAHRIHFPEATWKSN